MSDKAQRRFDPTPARKLKARRDGNIARSGDVCAIAAFAGAALAAFAIVPLVGAYAASMLASQSARPAPDRLPPEFTFVIAAAALPACAAGACALAAGLAQSGGLRFNLPKLDFNRLNPVTGLKRMTGAEAAVGALRAIAAFGVATAAVWPALLDLFTRSTALVAPSTFSVLGLDGAARACWSAIAVGACFAALDYAFARRRWLRDLKMTLEEIRRDQKENDGDPHARSRRKALHRTFVRGSIARTADASFVVVNPQHIAIAVRYAPPAVAVPEILVRAADDGARAVKLLARRHGIPIVENVALARALYAHGEAGRAIPAPTFVAVARVIAALIREGVLT